MGAACVPIFEGGPDRVESPFCHEMDSKWAGPAHDYDVVQFFIVLTDFLVYIYNFVPQYTKLLDVNTGMARSKKKLN